MADVYVTFGGDASALEATLASAKAAVNAYAGELRNLAKEMLSTGATADSEIGQRMQDVASHLTEAKGAVSELKNEMKGVGESAEGAGGVAGFFEEIGRSVKSVLEPIHSMSSSIGEIAEAALAAFAVEKVIEFAKSMGELGEATERMGAQLGLTPKQVGELSYQFQVTGTNADTLVRTMARFEAALPAARDGTGNVAEGLKALGLTAQELIGLSLPEQLGKIADATAGFADSPTKTAALQGLGRGFVELLPLLDQGSAGLEKFAKQADQTNSLLDEGTTEALVNMNRGFVELGASIKGLMLNGFEVLIPDVNGAVTLMSDFAKKMSDSAREGGILRDVIQTLGEAIAVFESGVSSLKQTFVDVDAVISGTLNSLLDWSTKMGDAFRAALSGKSAEAGTAYQAGIEKFKSDWTDAWSKIQGAAAQSAKEYKTVWGGATKDVGDKVKEATGGAATVPGAEATKPLVPSMDAGEAEKLTAQISTLEANLLSARNAAAGIGTGLQASTSDAAALIARFEGFKSAAKWDVNAFRVGYGSDTTTSPSGTVSPVTSDTTTTEEDAQRDLARRVVEFQTTAATEIGPAWAGLAENVKASLTSVAYNYGRLPSSVVGAARTGDNITISEAISALAANPSRRAAEAANVTAAPASALPATAAPGGTGAAAAGQPSPEKVQQWNAELDVARTKLQEIQDKQAGGNALAQEQLTLDQQSATQKQSAVTSLQAQYNASTQVVADDERRGITGEKLTKDLQEQAKLKTQLREATEAAAESELKLGVAASKNSGTAQQQFDAAKKLADYKISVAGADVAAQNAAKTELLAAETTYQNAVRAQIMQTQQMAIAAAGERAKSSIAKLNEELKDHQLTMAEWLTQATSVYEQEKTAVTAAYQAEIAAAGNKTQEVERLANEEQKTIAAISLQEQQAQSKAAEQAAANWQSAMNSINSAFDAQIDGLLTGTKSWQQAFKDVLKSLTEDLIKFGLNKALTLGENSVGGLFGLGPGPGAAASGLGGLGGIFGGGAVPGASPGQGGIGSDAAAAAHIAALNLNTAAQSTGTAATTTHVAATTGQTLATTTNTLSTTGNTVSTTAGTVGNTGNTVATATNTATQSTGIGAWIANTVATAANTLAEDANSIGKLFGFAEGTPMVKQTGVAMIHAGEAVIPAAMNPFKNLNVSLTSFTGDAVERARAGMAMIFRAPKLPAFDGGAWQIPHDMVAAVHGGETIVPAKGGMASEFRQIAAGGGFGGGGQGGGHSVSVNPSLNVNIHAQDSQDVARSLLGNSREVMKSIEKMVRQGSHLGLRRLNSF